MKTQPTHLASLFSVLVFVPGALLLFLGELVLGLSALTTFLVRNQIDAQSTIFFAALSFEGVILLVASIISFLKFLNKPAADTPMSLSFSNWQIILGVVGSGLALWIGSQIQGVDSVNWIVLPVLTIPAIALPLWTILGAGTRKASLNSRWRTWAVLGFSMTIVPFILIIAETAIALVIFMIFIAYLVIHPRLTIEIQRLSAQFAYVDPASEKALELLVPFLTKPSVVITILIFFSILVPLVEELFKPLGVWLLNGKLNSPSQGFALGALSGAGYGLVESVNVSRQVGEWGSLLYTRIGTGWLHVTTSALMGAAIVMAWRERRYLRLFGTYLLAVLLHGLWNTASLTYGFSILTNPFDQTHRFDSIQITAMAVMGLLAIILPTILLITNYKLRDISAPPKILETIPTDNPNDTAGT